MSNLTTDFFENNDHALRHPEIVLRDSLGNLAIQLLKEKEDISIMKYDDLLRKLHTTICELHESYQRIHGDFNE